ncbi:hypothetical protein L208DRAFT_1518591, partial [Tricholoma matsutake]
INIFVKFKISNTSDPFCDPEYPLDPKAGNFHFEKDTDNAMLVCGQLASYAAHMGSQFCVHIFLCAEHMRGSFVGIMMAQLLPTISNIPASSLASFGVTIILIIAGRVMTLLSHLLPWKIFNKSAPSKAVCGMTTLLIMNSVYSWFWTMMILKLKSNLSYHFLQSTWLTHHLDKPLES